MPQPSQEERKLRETIDKLAARIKETDAHLTARERELGTLRHKYLMLRDAEDQPDHQKHIANLLRTIDNLEAEVKNLEQALHAERIMNRRDANDLPDGVRPQPKKSLCPNCSGELTYGTHAHVGIIRCTKCGWSVAQQSARMEDYQEPEVKQLPATQEDIDESGRNLAKLSLEDFKPIAALGGLTDEDAVEEMWHALQKQYGKGTKKSRRGLAVRSSMAGSVCCQMILPVAS